MLQSRWIVCDSACFNTGVGVGIIHQINLNSCAFVDIIHQINLNSCAFVDIIHQINLYTTFQLAGPSPLHGIQSH